MRTRWWVYKPIISPYLWVCYLWILPTLAHLLKWSCNYMSNGSLHYRDTDFPLPSLPKQYATATTSIKWHVVSNLAMVWRTQEDHTGYMQTQMKLEHHWISFGIGRDNGCTYHKYFIPAMRKLEAIIKMLKGLTFKKNFFSSAGHKNMTFLFSSPSILKEKTSQGVKKNKTKQKSF